MRVLQGAKQILFIALVCLLTAAAASAVTTGVESLLHQFTAGENPSTLIQASDGNFYGTVSTGGADGHGYVFSLTPGGAIATVYSFTGGADGGVPRASLIEGNDGYLYGTDTAGGGASNGVLFKLTLSGSITVLHDFTTADGVASPFSSSPTGSLIQTNAGDIFGAAAYGGGPTNSGTIFEYSHSGVFSIVHTFTGGADGASPNAPLLQASDGLIYGVTIRGGTDPQSTGTIFRFNPADFTTFTAFTSFAPAKTAPFPTFGLTEGTDGALYGMTTEGGDPGSPQSNNYGTIYQVTLGSTPAANFALFMFNGGTNGGQPASGLTLGGDGNFYGTTSAYGPSEPYLTGEPTGTIFQYSPSGGGGMNVLYTFSPANGDPTGAPVEGADGNFYGPSFSLIYKLVPTPSVPAPITLTASAASITLGQSVTLSWQVTNAFSQTAENCWAHGAWSGNKALTGSEIVAPSVAGSYTYALTCGGVESALTTVNVTPVVTGQTATPVITPSGGTFNGPHSYNITDATPGAVIYYTIDGSMPTLSSPIWNGIPIVLNQTRTINAIAIAPPLTVSSVATANITIHENNPQSCSVLYNQGFYRHGGLTLNHGATVVGTGLRLTHGALYEYSSAFTNKRIPVSTFVTDFRFRFKDATASSADGLAFVLQANNPTALGAAGGNLGYTGIPNSMALKFDLHNNFGEGQNSVGLFFGGDYPSVPAIDLTPSGVNLHSGHTMFAQATYDGVYLTLALTDTVTAAYFTHTFTLPAINPFGATTAFAGFTAATGALTSTTEVVNWTLQSAGACLNP